MIERYGHDGRIIIVNGNVRSSEDDYDGIDETEDGRVIDKIISGIDPKLIDQSTQSRAQHESVALAQGVLFLIDKDMQPQSLSASVEQHPSAQNVSPRELSTVATDIINEYHDKLQQQEQYKKRANASAAARDVFIAVVRNLDHLSAYDREEIALALGHDKHFFVDHTAPAVATSTNVIRQRDWRERQANDDTLNDK